MRCATRVRRKLQRERDHQCRRRRRLRIINTIIRTEGFRTHIYYDVML
jgi:hypothetical protein